MTVNKKIFPAMLMICAAILACNLPSGAAQNSPVPAGGSDVSMTSTPSVLETITPTSTPIPAAQECKPTVTTNTLANVRSGPGTVYYIVGSIPQGGTAPVAGKNFDGTWWYIEFAGGSGGYGWIAASITTATCVPAALAIIAAPPTPIPPTATVTPVPSATPTGVLFIPIIPILPIFIPSATPTPTLIILFPVLPIIPSSP